MTNAIIENVSATAGHRHLLSQTDVNPDVTGFYDAPTGSIQYIVADPSTRKCAIIDPVLDFDPKSGSTRTTSVDRLLRYIEAHGLAAQICCDAQHHLTCSQAVGGLSATKR